MTDKSEIVPPWEAFPAHEISSMGWRMGDGEEHCCEWNEFIEAIPTDYDSRLAYLQRHRPAPLSWGDRVLDVLCPEAESDQEYGCSAAEVERLLNLGLVAHDAAYQTWLNGQPGIKWPWTLAVGDSPEQAARYVTREFWFFSRQMRAAREAGILNLVESPAEWRAVEPELTTGKLGKVDSAQGLLTLARMLCAGKVQAPWLLGLTLADFADSFDMDMGYCDAYRLWLMCAFDDEMLFRELLDETGVPDNWVDWIVEQTDGMVTGDV